VRSDARPSGAAWKRTGRRHPDAGSRHRQLTSPHLKTESHPHRKGLADIDGGRYAHGWQAGFRRGRIDALRCAMRQVDDLGALAVLTALVDEYELAAGDS
jgi:hypothetical protein